MGLEPYLLTPKRSGAAKPRNRLSTLTLDILVVLSTLLNYQYFTRHLEVLVFEEAGSQAI